MKKIYLLSLISILLTPAFSQISIEKPEILATVDITMNDDIVDDPIERLPHKPWWLFLYRNVVTEWYPEGTSVTCGGFGIYICFPTFSEFMKINIRGIASETLETTYKEMIEASKEQAANGEFQGSITRKLAYPDPERAHSTSYILFQMYWNNEPDNPRNGKAKIIISKKNDFTI